MPRQREPADVFYTTNDNTGLPLTPPTPQKPASKPPNPKQAPPDPKPTPPGPINLELRTGLAGDQTRIQLTQRVYDYTIEQTDDRITITGELRPTE